MHLDCTSPARLCECGCGLPLTHEPHYIYRHWPCSRVPFADRFWAHVDKSGDCWTWTGGRQWQNYGMFWNQMAHRIAYELTYGPISDGLVVCHHCDNPPCVRPDHLFLGTQKANLADCSRKGRISRGVNHHDAKCSEDDIRQIRRLYDGKKGTRAALAHQFNLSITHVTRIVRRQAWRHLSD